MYSLDRRELALHMYGILPSLRQVATLLKVSHTTIARWLQKPERKNYVRTVPSKSHAIKSFLKVLVSSEPLLSIHDMRKRILDGLGIEVSHELIRIVLHRSNITRKKARFFSKPAGHDTKRREFLTARDAFISSGSSFVSIDETSFGRHCKDVYGYAPKGELLKLVKASPRITTTSALCVIAQDTIIKYSCLKGSFNTDRFVRFLEGLELQPGTVFLLDNVRFHHSKTVKELAHSRGWHLLYTPPYSPWFNPIENVFSLVKRHYYKHQKIEGAFDAVQNSHIASCFQRALRIEDGP